MAKKVAKGEVKLGPTSTKIVAALSPKVPMFPKALKAKMGFKTTIFGYLKNLMAKGVVKATKAGYVKVV